MVIGIFLGVLWLSFSDEVMRYFNKRIESTLTYNSQCSQFLMFAFLDLWSKAFSASQRHSFVPVLGVADRVGRSQKLRWIFVGDSEPSFESRFTVGRTQGSSHRSLGYKGYEEVDQYSQKTEIGDDSGVTCLDEAVQND